MHDHKTRKAISEMWAWEYFVAKNFRRSSFPEATYHIIKDKSKEAANTLLHFIYLAGYFHQKKASDHTFFAAGQIMMEFFRVWSSVLSLSLIFTTRRDNQPDDEHCIKGVSFWHNITLYVARKKLMKIKWDLGWIHIHRWWIG